MTDEKRGWTTHPLLHIVIGAVLAIGGGAATTYWQTQAARSQAVYDRKLEAIRSYSMACQRAVSIMRRFGVLVLQVEQGTTGLGNTPLDENFNRLMTATVFDTEQATIALRSEMDFGNALFGTALAFKGEPPLFSVSLEEKPTPATLQAIRDERLRVDKHIQDLRALCTDGLQRFTANLAAP
jgi:hypothetical protein